MDARTAADQANQRMVDYLIAEGALWSRPLVEAFRNTPRHRFLERVFVWQPKTCRWREQLTREPSDAELRLIYSDRALITHLSKAKAGQRPVPVSSSSQPSLMAQMLEDLQLQPGLRVLEVGAGTGYNSALLAGVVGPDRVRSIDVDRSVLAEAWAHLRPFGERRIQLLHADGRLGLPEAAPFDRIMVTASTPRLERAWLEQLAPQGLLSVPLSLAPGLAFIVVGSVANGVYTGQPLRAAYFMPLRAEGEAGPDDDASASAGDEVQSTAAPWSDWVQRRRLRSGWSRLAQSLAFFALTRGHTIQYRTQQDGQPLFGVGVGAVCCWYGPTTWLVTGHPGRQLGERVWQAWLDAGGPWPTEFALRLDLAGDLTLGAGAWAQVERRERGGWV